jgi:lysozyme
MPATDISSQGNSLILQEEGWAPRAKWDYRQWTNGYGTKANGPNEVISREEAAKRFTTEVNRAADAVDKVLPKEAPQNIRDALTDFTFNVGTGWTRGSRLATALGNGDYNTAANIMAGYVHAGGQVLPDLVSRRQREIQLMMQQPTQPAQTKPEQAPVVSDDLNYAA